MLPQDPQLNGRSRRSAAVEETDGLLRKTPSKATCQVALSGIEASAKGGAVGGFEFVDHRITVALNVLSWLCDGQKREMQDILRKQKLFASTSIVSQVAFLLHGIAENFTEKTLQVAQCAVQSLIEMCAGNYDNQELAFKGQVIISIDLILKENITSHSAQEPLQKIKCSSIELLEVMLEETDKRSPILAEWVNSHLELTNFLGAMYELWVAFCSFRHASYKETLGRSIFRAYHVLRRIADYKGIQVNDLVGYSEAGDKSEFETLFGENYQDAKRMWQYCRLWSRNVEVVYKAKNGQEILTRVYFPYDPHKHLNEHEKDTILLEVKRNTPQEKLSDLLNWTKAIREHHVWKNKLNESLKTKWILWASTIRHFLLFWLTIIINLIVLFTLRVPESFDPESGTCSDDEQNDTNCLYFQPILSPEAPDIYFIVIRVLGSIHTLLAIWMVIQYMGKHWDNLRFSIPIINRGM